MGRTPKMKAPIERASLELFVEKGIDGASVRDIAQRAGVTEGALYRHHRSKDDLVRALFFRHYEAFALSIARVREAQLPFDSAIRQLVSDFLALYDEDPYVFRFVMLARHRLLDEVRVNEKNPVEVLAEIVRGAIAKGELPAQDVNLCTHLLLGMVLQVAVGHQYGRFPGKLAEQSEPLAAACIAIARMKGSNN